ncbi:MAG TPA: zinc ribbon domain-containing protein [Gemmatimonadales bacterium]
MLLSAGAVYYVLRPVLRPDSQAPAAGPDLGDDPEEDASPRARALRALREIEFDRATGKLSEPDYESLHAQYTALALEALRAEPEAAPRPPAVVPRAAPAAAPRRVCPIDGARPEPDAVFCSACGRRLETAPGFCVRCGTALEDGALFCARCGTRVAA